MGELKALLNKAIPILNNDITLLPFLCVSSPKFL